MDVPTPKMEGSSPLVDSENALERAAAQLIQGSRSAHAIQGARDVQVQNSSITVAGRDHQVTHNHFYNHEPDIKLKAILDTIANFRQTQQDTLTKATPGTILWLLECEEFKLFMDIDGILKILWGSGMPGAGKTVLASMVIARLEALAKIWKGQICIGYVYIRYSDQEKITIRGVLETLVKQTLEQHSDCVSLVQQAYETHLRHGTQPTEGELVQLLSQLNQKMKATFYVLDALDEAPVRIRLKLIQTLSSLGARLFITSRPLPALETKLSGASTFSIAAQDQDLDLHIEEKIAASEDLQDLLEQGGPSFKAHLISMVKDKCGGMFLHASLQLNALQGCFTVRQATQILETFPENIEDVYQQTWDRIVNSEPNYASLAKAAFIWVLNAKQSMTIEQLRQALATSPKTYRYDSASLMPEAAILASCRGLITIDKESKLVRLVHYTAQEPLKGLLCSDTCSPHSLLAAVCTTRLADCGFAITTIRSYGELQKALREDPLLSYAHDAWAYHAKRASDVPSVVDIVSTFVATCRSFPLPLAYDDFDLVGSLHLAAFYNFPLAFYGPCDDCPSNKLSNRLNRTILHWACDRGYHAIAQNLLRLPDNLVNLADARGWTALMLASMRGHQDTVKLLIADPGIEVNLAHSDGCTALIYASSRGRDGVVKVLLDDPRIQVNLSDNKGWTALIYASSRGRESVVKLLLAHPGMQVNSAESDGWTALINASKDGQEGIVKLLLADPRIQVNLFDNRGWTALIYASSHGHEGIVKLLLADSEIQVNLADSDGGTALIHASRNGHEGSFKLLLTHPSIDVNLAIPHGSSPLLIAAELGYTRVVELLLAVPNIDVNPIDGDGDTAIKMAADNGHQDIVRMLLSMPGINTSVRSTKDGHTAMSAAVAKGHHGIAGLLEQFEAKTVPLSLDPLTTTRRDTEASDDSQKGGLDSPGSTFCKDLGSVDLAAEDREEQKDEDDGFVHDSESDGSDTYQDALEGL